MVMLYAGSKEDLFGRWLSLVYAEAFRRMGIELLMKTCPPKRCSHWSDTGRADGELARVFSYNQTNPRMIRVDEPLVTLHWSAYSKDLFIKLNGWDSFKGTDYRVDYRLGLVEADLALNRVVRKDRLSTVKSVVQGLRKLSHGRSDVYVDVESTVLQYLQDDEFRKSGIRKVGIMEENSLHAFFHERNRFYVGRLSDILKDMKNEGLFLEYMNIVRNEHAIGKSVTSWPSGVTVHDPGRAYNGFTLFTSLNGDGTFHLIDMRGRTVHAWKMAPSHYGWLLPNGNLLAGFAREKGLGTLSTKTPAVGNVGGVYEADWEGGVLQKWEHDAMHHDYDKMPNGNIVALLWSRHERPQDALGGIPGTEYDDGVILSETIAEITPAGKIVWQWVAEDHLRPEDYPICPLDSRKRWLHANSLQYLPPDNPLFPTKELILVSLRQPSSCLIIDKATGKVLWKYGGYLSGQWGRLGHQHSFFMIGEKYEEPAIPGYGNLLIFDNGMHRAGYDDWGLPRSKVIEIDPKTEKVVWAFTHEEKFEGWMPPEFKFTAPYISGAQRLPNGNTLVCDGASGRIFETTGEGEIVWEFINPERKALFRAYRYGPGFQGFQGKGLPAPY